MKLELFTKKGTMVRNYIIILENTKLKNAVRAVKVTYSVPQMVKVCNYAYLLEHKTGYKIIDRRK